MIHQIYALPSVFPPGVQFTGQSSPVWNALTTLKSSSTLRPTSRSFTVMLLSMSSGLMMKAPLREIP